MPFCRAGQTGSKAAAASEGSVNRRGDLHPNCSQQPVAVEQDLVADSAHVHPIAGLAGLLSCPRADMLAGAHLVAKEHQPGWEGHS
jgi:hypothetical protein